MKKSISYCFNQTIFVFFKIAFKIDYLLKKIKITLKEASTMNCGVFKI